MLVVCGRNRSPAPPCSFLIFTYSPPLPPSTSFPHHLIPSFPHSHTAPLTIIFTPLLHFLCPLCHEHSTVSPPPTIFFNRRASQRYAEDDNIAMTSPMRKRSVTISIFKEYFQGFSLSTT